MLLVRPILTAPTVTLVIAQALHREHQALALLSALVLAGMQSAYLAWIAALALLYAACSSSSKICSTCV